MFRDQLQGHGPSHLEQPTLQAHLELPSIRSTPLDEFNRSQALLSLAIPGLYPEGKADFVTPRQRTISYADYLAHALK